MAQNIRTLDFLPEIFRTPVNSQFLRTTLDQLVSPQNLTNIEGFIGTKFGFGVKPTDNYNSENNSERTNYQLDPAVIFLNERNNKPKDFFSYPELINSIRNTGALAKNHNELFKGEFHTIDTFIDLDKLLNFTQYYWLPNGPETIEVYNVETLNVLEEVIGKPNFTSESGVKFSTGFKVVFKGAVSPESMKDVEYYVEGVGDAIKLIKVNDLIPIEALNKTDYLPFDSKIYDSTGFDSLSVRLNSDAEYITINRASDDLNGWTRANRWFHRDTIIEAAKYTNTSTDITAKRARRPIIEFYAGLKLFNSGLTGIPIVDYIDFTTTNAESAITGKEVVILPGSEFQLFNGARIIFAADPTRKNKVVTISTEPGQPLTILSEEVVNEDSVFPVFRQFSTEIKQFRLFKGNYIPSQTKTFTNQFPLFDVFDQAGVSFGNSTKYSQTTFTGSTLFQYSTSDSLDDPVLNFPIKYVSLGDLGDISFDLTYNGDKFSYLGSEPTPLNSGVVYSYNAGVKSILNGWVKGIEQTVQYQIFTFNKTQNTVVCDVPISHEYNIQNLLVYIGDTRLATDEYSVTESANSTKITLLKFENTIIDKVTVMLLSDKPSSSAYYDVPINLTNNPLNEDITNLSLGNIRNHFQSIFKASPNMVGNPFGSNNYRDLGSLAKYGSRIIRHENPIVPAALILHNSSTNIVDSLQYSANEYIRYKTELIYAVEHGEYSINDSPASILDEVITELVDARGDDQPFFWSDMVPNRLPHKQHTYKVQSSTSFPISKIYDFTKASYDGLLVYIKRTVSGFESVDILTIGEDYTLSATDKSVTITKSLLPTDTVIIKEFNSTYGSFVPATPTKLGFYPSFIPKVIEDDTYTVPAYFLQGHDGSLTSLYGEYNEGFLNDIRDRVLLEFEKRIFNNLKVKFEFNELLDEVVPGAFRRADKEEYAELHKLHFLNWVGQNRIDYRNQYYSIDDPKTWNYRDTSSKILSSLDLPGHWRGLFTWFYDTTKPHTNPWEMLGYTDKPKWWEAKYGVAPYSSTNAMWKDIELGLDWNNGNPRIIQNKKRPGLSNILPVDAAGRLLFPVDSLIADYNDLGFSRPWSAGDLAPAEFSYVKSSTYPFSLMKILLALRPAKFFSIFIDLDGYKLNEQTGQRLSSTLPLRLNQIEIYGTGKIKHSYLNWLVDYEKKVGNDGTAKIKSLLNNVDVRLVYRLAGFSDSDLLKFYIEHKSTSTNSSLLIPEESLNIILHNNEPEVRLTASSVVIQQTENGFRVWGHSQNRAFFVINKPIQNGEFDTVNYLGSTVRVPKRYSINTEIVPYGTEFSTLSNLASFIRSYGRYLSNSGLIFDTVVNGVEANWDQMIVETIAWVQTGWEVGSILNINPTASKIKINRENLVVSPLTVKDKNFILNHNSYPVEVNDLLVTRNSTEFVAEPKFVDDSISFLSCDLYSIEHGVVFDNQTVFNDIIYKPSLGMRQSRLAVKGVKSANWNGTVDASGFILNQDNIEDWIPNKKYVKGSIVFHKEQYWISNLVVQPNSVFDETEWAKTDYQLIQKGLLPNPSAKSFELTTFYDSLRPNLIGDSDLLSHSLIGYRPRSYLRDINLTELTQFNLYKTILTSKGTHTGAKLFNNKKIEQGVIDYKLTENWAIKNNEFGGVNSGNFVEFKLNKELLTGNPSLVKFTTGHSPYKTHQTVPMYDLFNFKLVLNESNFLPTTKAVSSVFPDAGYVNYKDIDVFSFNFDRLSSATNRNDLPVTMDKLYKNQYIWLADYRGSWEVFTLTHLLSNSTSSQVDIKLIRAENNLDDSVSLVFSVPHQLSKGELIAVMQFDELVNGYYKIEKVINNLSVKIALSLPPKILTVPGSGLVAKLQSRRLRENNSLMDVDTNGFKFVRSKLWVDEGKSGNWEVYENALAYKVPELITPYIPQRNDVVQVIPESGFVVADTTLGEVRWLEPSNAILAQLGSINRGPSFGTAMDASRTVLVVSKPEGPNEASRFVDVYNFSLIKSARALYRTQVIECPTGVNVWGKSISLSDDSNWLFVSADSTSVYSYYKDIDSVDSVSFTGYNLNLTSNLINELTVNSDARETFKPGQKIQILVTINAEEDEQEYQQYDLIHVSYKASEDKTYLVLSTKLKTAVTVSTPVQLVSPKFKFAGVLTLPAQMTSTSIKVDSSYDASTLVIGTSESSINGMTGLGSSVIYQRIIESIEVQANQPGEPYPQFVMTSNPNKITEVKLNDRRLIGNSEYFRSGNILVLTVAVRAGDIITVSTNEFRLAQTLKPNKSEDTRQLGAAFGTAVACGIHGTEILIGSPYDRSVDGYEGVVYRYSHFGRHTGIMTAVTDFIESSTPYTVYINGYRAIIPAGNITTVVDAINQYGITNVRATHQAGKITIYLVDPTLSKPGEKLTIIANNPDDLTKLGLVQFVQTQVITQLTNSTRSGFGSVVSINEFNSIVVSAPRGISEVSTSFDFTDDSNWENDTVFDNNFTQFIDTKVNHGSVLMFDLLSPTVISAGNNGKYVFSQYLNQHNINSLDNSGYGSSISFKNGVVVIAQPNLGSVIDSRTHLFVSPNPEPNWNIARSSIDPVDVHKINKIQLFNATTKKTTDYLDYFDPLQGKLLGVVQSNIDYIASTDPATYNINQGVAWGEDQLGKIWLDTSGLRFINTHQADVAYNSDNSGKLFPGSTVAVYTWIESVNSPVNYEGLGTPFSLDQYSEVQTVNASGIQVSYYYWVRATRTIHKSKTLSDYELEDYIISPESSSIPYVSFAGDGVIGLHNIRDAIDDDTVMHLGYNSGEYDGSSHTEFSLIQEGGKFNFVSGLPKVTSPTYKPQGLYKKIIHSLTGIDDLGRPVPDPLIPEENKYGTGFRPRQSMFKNRFKALENYLTFYNTWLLSFPYAETGLLSFLSLTGQNYNVNNFWEYADWYESGYSATSKITSQIDSIHKLPQVVPKEGMLVAVTTPKGKEVYVYKNLSWNRVGIENGTIQFKSSLWEEDNLDFGYSVSTFDSSGYDSVSNRELEFIIRAINEEMTREYPEIRNQALIILFNYAMSETNGEYTNSNWLMKTSLVDLSQNVRELNTDAKFSSQNQEFLTEFIDEIKPYHVVIKDYLPIFRVTDSFGITATDYDLPPQYSIDQGTYVTPELTTSEGDNITHFGVESNIWEDPEYSQWFANYGLSLDPEKRTMFMGQLIDYIDYRSEYVHLSNVSSIPQKGTLIVDNQRYDYLVIDAVTGKTRIFSRESSERDLHIPATKYFVEIPGAFVSSTGDNYINPPVIEVITATGHPAPRQEIKLTPVMAGGKLVDVIIAQHGSGYLGTPMVFVSASSESVIDPELITDDSLTWNNHKLTTGEKVRILSSTNDKTNKFYYVAKLSDNTLSLHYSLDDAQKDKNRVSLNFLEAAASPKIQRAAEVKLNMTPSPTRSIRIKSKYDRTTYNSKITPWMPGEFYSGPIDRMQFQGLASESDLLSRTKVIRNMTAIGGTGTGAKFIVSVPVFGMTYLNGAGTISASSGSKTVTGVNSNFTSLAIGQEIVMSNGMNLGIIMSIQSATSLTLVSNAAFPVTNESYIYAQAYYEVVIEQAGVNYKIGETLSIPGNMLNGGTSINNLTLVIDSVTPVGGITTVRFSGVPNVDLSKLHKASSAKTVESTMIVQQISTAPNVRLTIDYSSTLLSPGHLTGKLLQLTSAPRYFRNIAHTSTRSDVTGTGLKFDVMTPVYKPESARPHYLLKLASFGQNYKEEDVVIIDGSQVGGVSGVNDIYVTITRTTLSGAVINFYVVGRANAKVRNYYVKPVSATDIELFEDHTFKNPVKRVDFEFVVGDRVYVPYPLVIEESIVKFNGAALRCIQSNNDVEFDFTKWEIVTPGDDSLNALDRVEAYSREQAFNLTGVDFDYTTVDARPDSGTIRITADRTFDDIFIWQDYELELPENVGEDTVYNLVQNTAEIQSSWDLVVTAGNSLSSSGIEPSIYESELLFNGVRFPYSRVVDSPFSADDSLDSISGAQYTSSSGTEVIRDTEFDFGYGPEELMPGLALDTVSIRIISKPLTGQNAFLEEAIIEFAHTITSPVTGIENIDISDLPAIVETSTPHQLIDDDLVIMAGISGSVQLNSNLFLVRVIDPLRVALYYPNLDNNALDYDPVEGDHVAGYADHGVIMKNNSISIIDLDVTETASSTVTSGSTTIGSLITQGQVILTQPVESGTIIHVSINNAEIIKPGSEFRIEIDRYNEMSIFRVPVSAVSSIISEVTENDDVIFVNEPNKFLNKSVALLNGERVYYSGVNVAENKLFGVIRGIGTTAIPKIHAAGSKIEAVSKSNMLPRQDYNKSWHTMTEIVYGESLQGSETPPANFLT